MLSRDKPTRGKRGRRAVLSWQEEFQVGAAFERAQAAEDQWRIDALVASAKHLSDDELIQIFNWDDVDWDETERILRPTELRKLWIERFGELRALQVKARETVASAEFRRLPEHTRRLRVQTMAAEPRGILKELKELFFGRRPRTYGTDKAATEAAIAWAKANLGRDISARRVQACSKLYRAHHAKLRRMELKAGADPNAPWPTPINKTPPA